VVLSTTPFRRRSLLRASGREYHDYIIGQITVENESSTLPHGWWSGMAASTLLSGVDFLRIKGSRHL
jgi:hypothetical protein